VNYVNFVPNVLAAIGNDHFPIVFGDGRDERGCFDLGLQHPPVDVQVRAVGGEAERDSREPVHDESGHRGVRREVCVDVRDPASTHLPRKSHRFR
jgi:hypothetical protein